MLTLRDLLARAPAGRRSGNDARDIDVLRLGHLYPSLMNVYGDRGNIICLQRRCALRGIELDVTPLEVGDALEPDAYDLLFMGGAQDREQRLVASDLRRSRPGRCARRSRTDVPFLGVCGGYQMAGRFYRGADGDELPGAGVFDLYTLHPGARREAPDRQPGGRVGATARSSASRTTAGAPTSVPAARRWAKVVRGFGNDGVSGYEGARYRNAFGCYLHGPVLPKNPSLADELIGLALQRRYGERDLAPLDDAFE